MTRWSGGPVVRWCGSLLAALAVAVLPAQSAQAQDIDEGREALRTGKYQEAIAQLLKVPATDTQWVDAQRYLVRAYATIGKYDEAEAAARNHVDEAVKALKVLPPSPERDLLESVGAFVLSRQA